MKGVVSPLPMAMILVLAGFPSYAAEKGEAQAFRLYLELEDGSLVIGTVNLEAFNVHTGPDNVVEAPLRKIRRIDFTGDGARAEILFERGGNTLYGTLGLGELELETLLGRISIPVEHIARIRRPHIVGLVGYYPFNGNANDESGHGNHGTVHGAILTEDRFDNPDQAYFFDGEDDYIDCGAGRSLQVGGPDRSWTIALWINRAVAGKMHHVIGMGFGEANHAVAMGPCPPNFFSVNFHANALPTAPDFPDVNEWHHWTVTYDGTTNARRIYRDGQLVAQDVSPEDFLGHGKVYIAQAPWGARFHGRIDEVRFYNRALPAPEVRELFELTGDFAGGKKPPEGPVNQPPADVVAPEELESVSLLDGREFEAAPDSIAEEIRSRRYEHQAEPGSATFVVNDSDRLMKWDLELTRPIDARQWKCLEFEYVATGLYNDGLEYVLFLVDGRKTHHSRGFEAILPIEILADGQRRVTSVELRRFNPAGPITHAGIRVRSGKEGKASLWLGRLEARRDFDPQRSKRPPLSPADAARRVVPVVDVQTLESGRESLSLLDGGEFTAVPPWVHPTTRAAEKYGQRFEVGRADFRVLDANGAMKWVRNLDAPIDAVKWPLLEFQYRATGLRSDGNEYLLFLCDGRRVHHSGGFEPILPCEIVPDGELHTIVAPLARFNPAGPITAMFIRICSGEMGNALLRVQRLRFLSAPRGPAQNGGPVRSPEGFPKQEGQTARGTTELEPGTTRIVEQLWSEDPETRARAAVALDKRGYPPYFSDFITRALKGKSEDRSIYRKNLARKKHPHIVPALILALGDKDREVQEGAVETLGQAGDARAAKPLIAILTGRKDSPIRWRVALALGEIGGTEAEKALLDALVDPDDEVAGCAAHALGKIGSELAIGGLIAACYNEKWRVRMVAVQTLHAINHPQALERTIERLKDEHARVRKAAVEQLQNCNDPRIVDPLISLLKDPEVRVRSEAVTVLARFPSPRLVEPFIDLLSSDSSWPACTAAQALGKIGDKRAVEPLVARLTEDVNLRRNAALALDQLDWKPQGRCQTIRYYVGACKFLEASKLAQFAKPEREDATEVEGRIEINVPILVALKQFTGDNWQDPKSTGQGAFGVANVPWIEFEKDDNRIRAKLELGCWSTPASWGVRLDLLDADGRVVGHDERDFSSSHLVITIPMWEHHMIRFTFADGDALSKAKRFRVAVQKTSG